MNGKIINVAELFAWVPTFFAGPVILAAYGVFGGPIESITIQIASIILFFLCILVGLTASMLAGALRAVDSFLEDAESVMAESTSENVTIPNPPKESQGCADCTCD